MMDHKINKTPEYIGRPKKRLVTSSHLFLFFLAISMKHEVKFLEVFQKNFWNALAVFLGFTKIRIEDFQFEPY